MRCTTAAQGDDVMGKRALFISVKPEYAGRILEGSKRVELRRTLPRVEPNDEVLIYSSSPQMELVARARIGSVETASPTSMWTRVRDDAGVTRAEYRAYFSGASKAVAIWLTDVTPLSKPVSLRELRKKWPGFRPPQGYRYVAAFRGLARRTKQ